MFEHMELDLVVRKIGIKSVFIHKNSVLPSLLKLSGSAADLIIDR